MESENFKLKESKLKKPEMEQGHSNIKDLKLSSAALTDDLKSKVEARDKLADGELDERLKKASRL